MTNCFRSILGSIFLFSTLSAFCFAEVKKIYTPDDFTIKQYIPKDAKEAVLTNFDSHLWQGYISFDLSVYLYSSKSQVVVIDGDDNRWVTKWDSKVKFSKYKKLKTPVRIIGTNSDYYAREVSLKVTNVHMDLIKFPTWCKSFQGKFDGKNGEEENTTTLLHTFRSSYVFGKVRVKASAKLYANYTSGTECSRVSIVGSGGNKLTLPIPEGEPGAGDLEAIKTLGLPIKVYEDPICFSTPLPETADKNDYVLNVQLDDFQK